MGMGDESKAGASKDDAGLDELKHNLRVSFSRMKEDIHFNRQQVEDILKANKVLLEQITLLKDEIKELKSRPKGLKTELMRGLARNQKAIIKQRIVGMVAEARYSIPELKERIVDDKNYCSKASFYRYLEEMRSEGMIDCAEINGVMTVIGKPGGASGNSGAAQKPIAQKGLEPGQDRYV
jgi:hypothetical protein